MGNVQLEQPPSSKKYALGHYSYVLCGPVLLAGIPSVQEATLPAPARLFAWDSEAQTILSSVYV